MENAKSSSKRAFPKSEGLVVDKLTYEWFCRARSNNIPLSGLLIREKPLEIAKETGFVDFKVSVGWLEKFRTRYNISYKNICGEGSEINENVVTEWEEKMNDLCEEYSKKDCQL
ncbi:hypothetical protein PR048_003257 [Dryococelus australis]|uniref:HTH CENPB-type domain-containing protein n=1 Tax=Dryococelus australis TaxID=614101 RepID=A0ABQ9IMH3_9NEOP|nr:hypothetical protein PR048_003257 [Dryococelus australis]